MSAHPVPRRGIYAGLFLVCLATLMFELLLTRIFSVTTFYHFAFMAVSVGMFGMTVGAIAVYLRPGSFAAHRVQQRLSAAALLFAATLVPSFFAHLVIPFTPTASVLGFYTVALTYVLISVPFIFSGIVVSLALTRFPGHIGRLYAVDLIGASLACVLFVYILRVTDGPMAVVVVAAAAAAGAWSFAPSGSRLAPAAGLLAVALAAFGLYGTWQARADNPLVRVLYTKGKVSGEAVWERWNSFSRVAVYYYFVNKPFGWGMSPRLDWPKPVSQLALDIDAAAATALTNPQGNLHGLDFLRYDVTNPGAPSPPPRPGARRRRRWRARRAGRTDVRQAGSRGRRDQRSDSRCAQEPLR